MPDTKQRMDPVLVMALGGILGGLLGFAIWIATDTFVFLPVFLSAGLVSAIAIAQTDRRS